LQRPVWIELDEGAYRGFKVLDSRQAALHHLAG
jgi:hypothetical protein